MEERNRKIIGEKSLSPTSKRELLSREIRRPDGAWIMNWLGWNYAKVHGKWYVTPESPIFDSEAKGQDWLKSKASVTET